MKTPKQEFEQIIKAFEIIVFLAILPFLYAGYFIYSHRTKILILGPLCILFIGLAFAYWL